MEPWNYKKSIKREFFKSARFCTCITSWYFKKWWIACSTGRCQVIFYIENRYIDCSIITRFLKMHKARGRKAYYQKFINSFCNSSQFRLTGFYNGSRLIFPWVRIVKIRHALSSRSRYYANINRQPWTVNRKPYPKRNQTKTEKTIS